MKGAGIWLRQASDLTPAEAAEYLDFVVVSLSSERGRINRGPTMREWMAEAKALGVELWAMDWLPKADASFPHLPGLAEAAVERGCVGMMGDHEPDARWRDARKSASLYATGVIRHVRPRGLQYAVTDYGRGGMNRGTMERLLAVADYGVPQSYDPKGTYAEDYHARSHAYWADRGAQKVVMGLGLWLRGERRHRGPREFQRHMQGVPDECPAVCAWYGATGKGRTHRELAAVLPMLRAWAQDRGQRHTPPAPPTFREELVDSLGSLVDRAEHAQDALAMSVLGDAYATLARCAEDG